MLVLELAEDKDRVLTAEAEAVTLSRGAAPNPAEGPKRASVADLAIEFAEDRVLQPKPKL